MAKISAYPDFVDESGYAVIIDGGVTYKIRLDNLLAAAFADSSHGGIYVDDFMSAPNTVSADPFNQPYPYQYSGIGAGLVGTQAGEENHPGIHRLLQNGANTGASVWLGNTSNILLAGEEETEFVFKFFSVAANIVVNFGFLDNFTGVATPSDGAYLALSGNITGVAINNSVVSATGTSYSPSANTWYRGRVVVNSNATRVDFYLYDDSGNLLWTDFVTTNIPTAAGRELSHGVRAYKTSIGTDDIVYLDYMSLFLPRALTR